MALPDAVRPLALESTAEGGNYNATWPTEIDPSQDALTAAGLYVQNTTNSANDKTTLISRGAAGLTFTDANTSHVLKELVSSTSGQVGSHNAILDVIHFLADGGPGDGWAPGCVQTTGYAGPLLTSTVWWTDSTLAKKIFSIVFTYSGPLVSTATYALYNASGTLVRQVVDTFAYSGPLATSTTRTWS